MRVECENDEQSSKNKHKGPQTGKNSISKSQVKRSVQREKRMGTETKGKGLEKYIVGEVSSRHKEAGKEEGLKDLTGEEPIENEGDQRTRELRTRGALSRQHHLR